MIHNLNTVGLADGISLNSYVFVLLDSSVYPYRYKTHFCNNSSPGGVTTHLVRVVTPAMNVNSVGLRDSLEADRAEMGVRVDGHEGRSGALEIFVDLHFVQERVPHADDRQRAEHEQLARQVVPENRRVETERDLPRAVVGRVGGAVHHEPDLHLLRCFPGKDGGLQEVVVTAGHVAIGCCLEHRLQAKSAEFGDAQEFLEEGKSCADRRVHLADGVRRVHGDSSR